jgi:N6-adenosine-specific RNA methylase IME4
MEYHPLANIFPLMEGAAFDALAADIKINGVRDPLVMFEDMLLDGRNRWRASEAVGITITAKNIRQFDLKKDGDPLAWVISKNLQRRHLDEGQRAWVGAKVETLRHGGDRGQDANLRLDAKMVRVARKAAAILLAVSMRSICSAAVVRDHGSSELQREVEQGHIPISLAEKAAKMEPEDQAEVAARAANGEINTVRKVIKQKLRKENEAALGAKQFALPIKKYGVIVADPEWKFETWSQDGLVNSSPDNHYPTSELPTIKARDVASIAADDCVLFLWGTVPMTPQALEVMAAWGFKYVTNFAWVKDKAGTGYWNRNQHETLFVGTKGKPPAPAPGMQWSSVIFAPVGEHSEKPELSLEMIEAYFPTLPKIELNRRGPARDGWDAWGNEAEQPDAEVAA